MIKPLLQYRKELDKVDDELRKLLAKRFTITEAIGKYKEETGMPVVDDAREAEMKKKQERELKGNDQAKYIRAILTTILTQSKQQQSDLHKDTASKK